MSRKMAEGPELPPPVAGCDSALPDDLLGPVDFQPPPSSTRDDDKETDEEAARISFDASSAASDSMIILL